MHAKLYKLPQQTLFLEVLSIRNLMFSVGILLENCNFLSRLLFQPTTLLKRGVQKKG